MAKAEATTKSVEMLETDKLRDLIEQLQAPQRLVIMMVAEWAKPAAIMAEVAETFGEDHGITLSWVNSVSSWAERPKMYKPLIRAIRRRMAEIEGEPSLDPAWRLKHRREAIERALALDQFPEVRQGLNDLDRLLGLLPQFSNGPAVAVQVNAGGGTPAYGDMNRPCANDAERKAWQRHVAAEFGMPVPDEGTGDDEGATGAGP